MFTAIIWNARGIRNTPTRTFLKTINRKHSPSLIAILEPMIHGDNITDLAKELHMTNQFHGGNTNSYIWIMWNSSIDLSVSEIHKQFINCKIRNCKNNNQIVFSIVYASCKRHLRRDLWQDLTSTNNHNLPWILAGDFNIVAKSDEHCGPGNVNIPAMTEFNKFIDDSSLIDAGFVGSKFTWCNGLIHNQNTWQRRK